MINRYDYESMMFQRVLCFTPEQDAVIRSIEETTQAEVIITIPYHLKQSYLGPDPYYNAFLSRPEIYKEQQTKESSFRRLPVPCPEVNGELTYIRERPMKKKMTEEELQRYPEFLRMAIGVSSEMSETGSPCDIVTSECSGENIDRILQRLLSFTSLLKMGWHLGLKRDFCEPFEWEYLPFPARKKRKSGKKSLSKKPKSGTSE